MVRARGFIVLNVDGFEKWPVDIEGDVRGVFQDLGAGFIVTDGVDAVVFNEVVNKIAFEVFNSQGPFFFKHFEIDMSKKEGFDFSIVNETAVAGLPGEVVGESFADAVGTFFAHADIDEVRGVEGVGDGGLAAEDEV